MNNRFRKLWNVIIDIHWALMILLTFIVMHGSAIIPDYIQVCQANEKDIAGCINNSVNHLRPRLKTGIPELDVPPLEPLLVDEIKLKTGSSGAALNCNITNLKVWGPASFIVTEMNPNINQSRFRFKVKLPNLYFKGDYVLNMKILLIDVNGKGLIHGNLTNFGSDVLMKGKKILKDDQEYLKFDKIRLKLLIGKGKVKLENLFNNDSLLGPISNDIVNENSDLFINEIKPALENSLAEKFTEIANKITLKFTYKELFP